MSKDGINFDCRCISFRPTYIVAFLWMFTTDDPERKPYGKYLNFVTTFVYQLFFK